MSNHIEVGDFGYAAIAREKHLPLDYEECGNCHAFIHFPSLGNGKITTHYEGRGEFWGAPCSECIVNGFICPCCGKHNSI
jgi:hypothetical protein